MKDLLHEPLGVWLEGWSALFGGLSSLEENCLIQGYAPFQGRLSSSDRPVWKRKGLNLSHPGLGQLCRVIPAPKLPTGLTEAFVTYALKLDFFLC